MRGKNECTMTKIIKMHRTVNKMLQEINSFQENIQVPMLSILDCDECKYTWSDENSCKVVYNITKF